MKFYNCSYSEEQYSVTATTDKIITSNFDIWESVSAGSYPATHTYAVEYKTSSADATLQTNPTQSIGTATSYIQLTEQIVNEDIMQNVVEDTNPVLGGQLNADNKKIINLAQNLMLY